MPVPMSEPWDCAAIVDTTMNESEMYFDGKVSSER